MQTSTKLIAAKVFLALSVVLFTMAVLEVVSSVSHAYCHGSSHNARGAYCEAVYSEEEGYRAL